MLSKIRPDTEWHWYEGFGEVVMARWKDGEWQTRPMTEAEQDAYMASRMGW